MHYNVTQPCHEMKAMFGSAILYFTLSPFTQGFGLVFFFNLKITVCFYTNIKFNMRMIHILLKYLQ